VASGASDNKHAMADGGIEAAVAGYRRWVGRQPLAAATRRAYRRAVGEFGAFLEGWDGDAGDPLVDPHARDFAARDFKAHLKAVRRRSPRSVNLALAAVDSFYRQLGLGSPQVARERLPAQAPRALEGEEVKRLLRAVERTASVRDRALVGLLFYTACGSARRRRWRSRTWRSPRAAGGW
jgi:integrase